MSTDIARVLLGDMEPAAFFGGYWDRSWLKLSGPRDRFASLFASTDLMQHAIGDLTQAAAPSLSYTVAHTDERGTTRSFGAPLEMAADLLAAGMTLSFTEVEHVHPRVGALVRDVAAFLGARAPITATSFVSPPDHGFPWHFDYPHVFAMQVEGSKRWLLGRTRVPAAPWTMEAHGPRAQATFAFVAQLGLRIEPPVEGEWDEITLEPGDVLYMPPGTWHRAIAQGGASCHLSLLNRPITFGRVLRAWLAAVGLGAESWRADLQRLPPGELDQALRARIAELQRQVASLTPERLVRVLDLLTSSPTARLTLLERARDVM